jgi:hypothetical protein
MHYERAALLSEVKRDANGLKNRLFAGNRGQ